MRPFDETGVFRPMAGGPGASLRTVAVRSAAVTAFSQGLKVVLQLGSTIILARLLTPSDFGILTMVTTFSLLFLNFGLNGFTEAIIQRPDLEHRLASNVFWVNLACCAALTLAFAGGGPLLAKFYKDPRVASAAAAMALTILFTGLSVVHIALLRRAMRFSTISVIEILAQSAGILTSIILGARGWGYWALVVGAVVLPFVSAVGSWIGCRWIPGLPHRGAGTRPMVKFALNIYGYFTVNYFSGNVDNVLVGSYFGPNALGFYKKAFDLALFPLIQASGPLNSVAVPTLSRLTHDTERYCRYILRSLSILALLGMGVGACMTLVGDDVILVLLGPKWAETGRIFRFFAPGIGAMFVYRISGWLHLSMGTANRFLRWGIIEFVVLGSLFLLGVHWGPIGVGLVWGVSCWILTIPAIAYAPRPKSLTVGVMLSVIWRYAVASALAGGACLMLVRMSPWQLPLSGAGAAAIRLVLTSSVFAVLYICAVALLHGGWSPILEVSGLVRDMLPSRKVSAPASAVASIPSA